MHNKDSIENSKDNVNNDEIKLSKREQKKIKKIEKAENKKRLKEEKKAEKQRLIDEKKKKIQLEKEAKKQKKVYKKIKSDKEPENLLINSERKEKLLPKLFINKKEKSSTEPNTENSEKPNAPVKPIVINDNVEIKCVNIEKTVKELGSSKTTILKNINLEINKGEITVILGPSGSGKTTLLNVIAGIDKATSGQCYIKKVDINSISDKKLVLIRRKYISYIYQRYGLIPILSCYDNIRLGQHLVEKSKRELDINEVIKIVGIEHLLEKFPHELSGGQRQRVAIARAIMKQPEVMLCDEPTAALDSETSKKIIDLFLEVNKKFNTTIVMVTHEPSFVRIATKVIYIKDGEIEKIDIRNKNNNQLVTSKTFEAPKNNITTNTIKSVKEDKKERNIIPTPVTTIDLPSDISISTNNEISTFNIDETFKNEEKKLETDSVAASSIEVKVLDSKLNKEVSHVDDFIKKRKLDKYIKKVVNKK